MKAETDSIRLHVVRGNRLAKMFIRLKKSQASL